MNIKYPFLFVGGQNPIINPDFVDLTLESIRVFHVTRLVSPEQYLLVTNDGPRCRYLDSSCEIILFNFMAAPAIDLRIMLAWIFQ
jgi:hypothetical protein